jgi:hypothetical protein
MLIVFNARFLIAALVLKTLRHTGVLVLCRPPVASQDFDNFWIRVACGSPPFSSSSRRGKMRQIDQGVPRRIASATLHCCTLIGCRICSISDMFTRMAVHLQLRSLQPCLRRQWVDVRAYVHRGNKKKKQSDGEGERVFDGAKRGHTRPRDFAFFHYLFRLLGFLIDSVAKTCILLQHGVPRIVAASPTFCIGVSDNTYRHTVLYVVSPGELL